MRQHVRRPALAARQPRSHAPVADAPAAHPLLSLQRQIGNRAVQRLLRPPAAGVVLARSPDDAAPATAPCALTVYSGSNFTGKAVVADVEFVATLDSINKHAADNDVNLLITDSFRPHGKKVTGAIVTPATRSNHLAGHAIDMNVMYGPGKKKLCNSGCLGGSHPPAPVKAFIDAIKADGGLRWGGDFADTDPVHIDDGLNADDAAWRARFTATQQAHQNGCP